MGYSSDSFRLYRYDRDASGKALQFWMKDLSNENVFVLVVASSGAVKTVPVPSTRSYLNSHGECVAWVDSNVLHFASGKSIELASPIFDSGIDRSGRYCYFVYEDPDIEGPSSRSSEIVAVANPEEALVRFDGFITDIFTDDGNVFVLSTDYARIPGTEWSYIRGLNCYTYVETSAGLELKRTEYIPAPSSTAILTVMDMDAQNGRIYILDRFDVPQGFWSPRYIYDMQSRTLVRIGRGIKRGLFLRDDIIGKQK